MVSRVFGAACVVALAIGVVVAGAAVAGKMHDPEALKAMKAEMEKCAVCKHMAAHMEELAPVMTMDVAMLNDGIAMIHGVTDEAKLPLYREVGKKTHSAGEACMTMTDEQAKAQLCEWCQEIRSVMKAGAKMSMGETKMGDVMVLTSSDAAVQKQLAALGEKCATMASSM